MIEKTFDPAAIEAKWYAHWEQTGAFRPHRPDAEPYTIVIPPPNVTGSLHIGHALDCTLQDVLVRYERLRGKDALWVVGTDHAGIATQMVVERLLDAEGVKRTDMGRDAFLERVWQWKAESGGAITRQLRRLGASCDWANERFTMDEGFSAAVTKVFVDLHREGLIYRDKRLVNWDPKLKTAISDLEVEQREVDGHMWHFRYPLADPPEGGPEYIAIATTRPETILGDGAVAVHPDDERYRGLVGRFARLPIVDRLIPIIADVYVDPAFGSGAVKITAAHDFNDYAVYKRHPDAGIPLINLMTADAAMNDATPEGYRGLDRYEARAKVVADFEAMGLLDKIEPHRHNVPHGDRSGVAIEPWLTDQWYVDAAKLAEAPMAAVRAGETRFVPETWEKTFFQWMENIQPWCVSRQLWWGHRIPAWYGPTKNGSELDYSSLQTFVGETVEAVQQSAHSYYFENVDSGEHSSWGVLIIADTRDQAISRLTAVGTIEGRGGSGVGVWRDPDVLDTWFSSALWPFGTLGWGWPPNELPDHMQNVEGSTGLPFRKHVWEDPKYLARHYPNTTLVTGFDIIFFWVARMQMMGHRVMGAAPFHTVYCHGLVRDARGQKMSKSKGNAVDPLGLIDKYGADALRFFMAAMETQGRDIKMSEPRVEGYRNFATKLWNAARFAQANGIGGSDHLEPPPAQATVNQWIIAETVQTIQSVELALAEYRFDTAAATIYRFVWSRFCDWYLELIKPLLAPTNDGVRADDTVADETRRVAGWVLDQILVVLHPFMPFITEELWHALKPGRTDLILARWPVADARRFDSAAPCAVDFLIRLVEAIRAARAELNVPGAERLPLHLAEASPEAQGWAADFAPALERLARVSALSFDPAPPGGAAQIVLAEGVATIPLEGVIDLAAERVRLTKARETATRDAAALTTRLANPGFLAKAAPAAVEEARDKLAVLEAEAARLTVALERLG